MRKSDQMFTSAELRMARWIVIAAAVLVALMLALDGMWSRPLGRYGMDDLTAPPPPGILDARPMTGSL